MRLLAQSQSTGSAHPSRTLSSSYRSGSNGLFRGAHFLLVHCRLYQLFQMWGAQHVTNSMPSTRTKTSSNPVNNQANDEHTPRISRGRYGDNTYCSSMALELFRFPWRRWTGTNIQANVLLHWWGSQQDRYWSGLKQQAQEMRAIMERHKNVTFWKDAYHCRRPFPATLDCVRGCYWQRALEHYQRETKRRVTTARRRLKYLRVSASTRTSSQPEEVIVASLTRIKTKFNQLTRT